MRKHKAYFGQNKVKHKLGRRNGQWVVPRLLREYFNLRHLCRLGEQSVKINMNHSFGKLGGSPYGKVFKTTASDKPMDKAFDRGVKLPSVPMFDHMDIHPRGDSPVDQFVKKVGEAVLDKFKTTTYAEATAPSTQEPILKLPKGAGKTSRVLSNEAAERMMSHRRNLKAGYLGMLSVPAMREVLGDMIKDAV